MVFYIVQYPLYLLISGFGLYAHQKPNPEYQCSGVVNSVLTVFLQANEAIISPAFYKDCRTVHLIEQSNIAFHPEISIVQLVFNTSRAVKIHYYIANLLGLFLVEIHFT